MIKIDFHIHTVSTQSDSAFDFDLNQLKEYVRNTNINAIAITNHNVFDVEQFKLITETLDIQVFPGIEINLEKGHLLLIADGSDLDDYSSRCEEVTNRVSSAIDSISVDELSEIFPNLDKYLLIPHYEKKPAVPEDVVKRLSVFITAGEVNSPKKFMYCLKDKDRLVPVYFSDCRIAANLNKFSARQTYLGCDKANFTAIKSCLRDKNKVSLSSSEVSSLFEIFDNGQKLSTGINVIIGERSSGKSYTLDKINREFDNIRHIKQFSLVARDDKENERKFNKMLAEQHSLLSRDYLGELQYVVNDVIDIDIEENSNSVSRYLDSLIKYAKESEKHDTFSKAKLFSEEEFQTLNQKGLTDLISSAVNLIENVEFKKIIEKHVSIQNIKELILELMSEYGRREKERLKMKWLNDLIKETKNKLQIKSAATTIKYIDLYRIAMDLSKIEKFINVVRLARRKREIMRNTFQRFVIVAIVGEFDGAGELKKLSRLKSAFRDAYDEYEDPYKYLQQLKNIDNLEEADYSKYFVKIEYKILNEDGFEVSGGERSEFNLLQEIQDAQKYDMLLIDEPESSFDNLFLKKEVNEIIKDISKNMPVVLVTHNSTVGASIKPDYLLCTKKEVIDGKIEYRIYSGFPTSKELLSSDGKSLNNLVVTMDCLEAGEQTYNERRQGYEDLKN